MDEASPVGILLAVDRQQAQTQTTDRPMRSQPTPMSGRERGRLFRQRQQQKAAAAASKVAALRDEVDRLQQRAALATERALQRRNGPNGSLARVVREYMAMFAYGLGGRPPPSSSSSSALLAPDEIRQTAFLRSILHPDVCTGGMTGCEASLTQWRIATAAYRYVETTVVAIEVSGKEDNPVVSVRTVVRSGWSEDTLRCLFPGALEDEALMMRLVDRDVTFAGGAKFWFTSDGRIAVEQAEMNVMANLLGMGLRLADVVVLTRGMTATCDGHVKVHDMQQTTNDPPLEMERRSPLPRAERSLGRRTDARMALEYVLGAPLATTISDDVEG